MLCRVSPFRNYHRPARSRRCDDPNRICFRHKADDDTRVELDEMFSHCRYAFKVSEQKARISVFARSCVKTVNVDVWMEVLFDRIRGGLIRYQRNFVT